MLPESFVYIFVGGHLSLRKDVYEILTKKSMAPSQRFCALNHFQSATPRRLIVYSIIYHATNTGEITITILVNFVGPHIVPTAQVTTNEMES